MEGSYVLERPLKLKAILYWQSCTFFAQFLFEKPKCLNTNPIYSSWENSIENYSLEDSVSAFYQILLVPSGFCCLNSITSVLCSSILHFFNITILSAYNGFLAT